MTDTEKILTQLIGFAKEQEGIAANDSETKRFNQIYYLGKEAAYHDIVLRIELLLTVITPQQNT